MSSTDAMRTIALCAVCAWLGACAGANGGRDSNPATVVDNAVPVLAAAPDAALATALIDYVARLHTLDEEARAQAVAATVENYAKVRSPANAVALALALQSSAPHEQDDPALRSLLSAEPPPAMEVARLIRQRLSVNEQAARNARADIARARRLEQLETTLEQNTAMSRKQLRALRGELDRAEAQIEALTSIEEEIRRTGLDGSPTP